MISNHNIIISCNYYLKRKVVISVCSMFNCVEKYEAFYEYLYNHVMLVILISNTNTYYLWWQPYADSFFYFTSPQLSFNLKSVLTSNITSVSLLADFSSSAQLARIVSQWVAVSVAEIYRNITNDQHCWLAFAPLAWPFSCRRWYVDRPVFQTLAQCGFDTNYEKACRHEVECDILAGSMLCLK